VYTVCTRAIDGAGNTSPKDCMLLPAYDPDGSFVSGGGSFESLEGALTHDTTLTGRAKFGFISKYKRGATVPSGQTEFQFKVADLNTTRRSAGATTFMSFIFI